MARGERETEAERRARHAREVERDLVRDSTRRLDDGTYTRGIDRADYARMALARQAAGLELTDADRDAIAAHPDPPSGITGLPGWATRGNPGR